MVLLTRHEESIKARLCFAFLQSTIQSIFTSIFSNSFFTQAIFSTLIFESLWTSSSSSFSQKLSKVFWFSKPWKQNLCYSSFSFPSPFDKKNSPRTNRLNSFCVSLLSFPKEWRTNRLNSFDSSLSLIQKYSKD